MKVLCILFVMVGLATTNIAVKRDTTAVLHQRYDHFRPNCYPRGNGKGCTCAVTNTQGEDETKYFDNDDDCKKPVEFKTAENKKELNKEIEGLARGLKENCYPRPGGKGCRCVEKDQNGNEVEKRYDDAAQCHVTNLVTGLKKDCYPRPAGKGCRCLEKDKNGIPVEKKYDDEAECKLSSRKRRGNIMGREQQQDQNVRDPVRERAQKNYAAVIQELKDKFQGLREGCFPRPKGCLCVVGKNAEGREITERRFKDSECKCGPNERSAQCPAPAA